MVSFINVHFFSQKGGPFTYENRAINNKSKGIKSWMGQIRRR